MCHQTVGLVQAAIEHRGIATVSITLLSEITQKIGVSRSLSLPYPLGFPLGAPHDPTLQGQIVRKMLAIGRSAEPGITRWEPT